MNGEIHRVFEGLVTIPGEIERIFFDYLPNWLNREIDEKERAIIKKISEDSYYREWKNATAAVYAAIKRAIAEAKLQVGNEGMNNALAQLVAPVLISLLEHHPNGRDFEILDVGAGEGKTTMALLIHISFLLDKLKTHERLGTDLMNRLHIYTLEPGKNNLNTIGTMLEGEEGRTGFMDRINRWTPLGGMFQSHMGKYMDGEFDMIISSATLHHLTDPSYLDTVSRLLRDNGIFAVGDWYTTLFKHPALLIPTLRKLGADDTRIRRYKNYFGIYKEDLWVDIEERDLTEKQRKANEEMRDYVIKVAEEYRALKKEDLDNQLRLFEGHRSLADHMKGAKRAGIEIDRDVLSERLPGFGKRPNFVNVNPGSDISSAWFGSKLRKPLAVRGATALSSLHA